jgi:hypothetical protein
MAFDAVYYIDGPVRVDRLNISYLEVHHGSRRTTQEQNEAIRNSDRQTISFAAAD